MRDIVIFYIQLCCAAPAAAIGQQCAGSLLVQPPSYPSFVDLIDNKLTMLNYPPATGYAFECVRVLTRAPI